MRIQVCEQETLLDSDKNYLVLQPSVHPTVKFAFLTLSYIILFLLLCIHANSEILNGNFMFIQRLGKERWKRERVPTFLSSAFGGGPS